MVFIAVFVPIILIILIVCVGVSSSKSTDTRNAPIDKYYKSLCSHICLSIFTLGIWQLIWIYRMTAFTNIVDNKDYRKPSSKLLLCIFIPLYIIFWIFKTAQRVDILLCKQDSQTKLTNCCLLLSIFVPFLSCIFLQDGVNEYIMSVKRRDIIDDDNEDKSEVSEEIEDVAGEDSVSILPFLKNTNFHYDEDGSEEFANDSIEIQEGKELVSIETIKKYKDLLDKGIITQEEFNAKKKQILGL